MGWGLEGAAWLIYKITVRYYGIAVHKADAFEEISPPLWARARTPFRHRISAVAHTEMSRRRQAPMASGFNVALRRRFTLIRLPVHDRR